MFEFVVGRRADMREALYDKLLQYRHEIFVRRLGWDLPARARKLAREEDEFDTPHSIYVTATHGGHVCGCARLLPTTKPYLIERVFPDLLAGGPLGAFAIRVTRSCEAETRAVLAARSVRWLLSPAARAACFCSKEEPRCKHEQHFAWRCA